MSDEETVPVENVGKAKLPTPPEEPPLPKGTDPFTGKGGTYDKELGLVGRFVGGNTEKSGNIAFIVILLCLVFMGIVFLTAYDPDSGGLPESIWNLLSLLGSIVTGCVGFIFGDKNSNSK